MSRSLLQDTATALLQPPHARHPRSVCEELVNGAAHPIAVRNDDVENQLSYIRQGSGAPEVFEGIYWMDQTGYYQTRPDRPDQGGRYEVALGESLWHKTFPHTLPSAAAELLLSFGGSAYDNETRCVRVSMRTDQWLWANVTGTVAGSVSWAGMTQMGFIQFCFDEAMSEISISRQPCNADGELGVAVDMSQRAIPRPWGLERLNRLPGQAATRYAAYQIVDGRGQRTEHYKAWLDFMQTQCWFSPQVVEKGVPFANDTLCHAQGGWHVNLGNGFSVLGRRGPA